MGSPAGDAGGRTTRPCHLSHSLAYYLYLFKYIMLYVRTKRINSVAEWPLSVGNNGLRVYKRRRCLRAHKKTRRSLEKIFFFVLVVFYGWSAVRTVRRVFGFDKRCKVVVPCINQEDNNCTNLLQGQWLNIELGLFVFLWENGKYWCVRIWNSSIYLWMSCLVRKCWTVK